MSAGMVPRGNGIPIASKAERRQTNTLRNYKEKWIRAKKIGPREAESFVASRVRLG